MKEIKIKTPYGIKNWSFVKRVLDTHQKLINDAKLSAAWFADHDMLSVAQKIRRLIDEAEGNIQ